jgi:hypothetical protein
MQSIFPPVAVDSGDDSGMFVEGESGARQSLVPHMLSLAVVGLSWFWMAV